MALASGILERARNDRRPVPMNAAELAELDLLYRRKGAELGLCGFGFVRDYAAGPREIQLFLEDARHPSLSLTKLDDSDYLLSRGEDAFPLPSISALSRMIPWLRARS